MRPRRPAEPAAAPEPEWAPEPAEFETVLGPEGVADLLSSLRRVADIPGDIVECGSWRGGSAMIIAEALRRRGSGKIVYAW